MNTYQAWIFLSIWFLFPIVMICLDKNAGQWRASTTSGCPFGPRSGWLIIILFLGVIGLILFKRAIKKRINHNASSV